MTPHDRPGLASIIIPCWNQLEFTRQCVAALVRHTREPWELILIDNGSTDGTKDYCAGVRDAAPVPVTVLTNTTNRGFPAAINQGLQRARGEYLVLLNNDVVVTDGWLDQLTALATAATGPSAREDHGQRDGGALPPPPLAPSEEGVFVSGGAIPSPQPSPEGEGAGSSASAARVLSRGRRPPWQVSEQPLRLSLQAGDKGASRIGLVGPMSNDAAPPQLVEAVPYHDLGEMPMFARRWREWYPTREYGNKAQLTSDRVRFTRIGRCALPRTIRNG